MTRQEILDRYTLRDGIIVSPGKFEGEMLYVPYFWEQYIDGGADEDDGDIISFTVTEDDVREFPELEGTSVVRLVVNDQGFVMEV